MGERGDRRLLLSNREIHYIHLLARMSPPLSFLQRTDVFATVRSGQGGLERGANAAAVGTMSQTNVSPSEALI